MMAYEEIFADYVNNIKAEGRYREFVDITRLSKDFPCAINNNNGKKVVLWCINDYLRNEC
jgi:5-aminolevulinate synthase